MLGLADILRQCRAIVVEHHPLTKTELIDAIDAKLQDVDDDAATEETSQDMFAGPVK